MNPVCERPSVGLQDPEVLCSVLGHELRNPLAAALASAHVVEAMTAPEDPRSGYVKRMFEDLERLRASLDALLCLGSRQLRERQVVDLTELVTDLLHRRGGSDRPEWDRVVEGPTSWPEDTTVFGDPSLIERAIENLLENSLRAGASRVQIRCSVVGGEIQLRVCDDGKGLPEGPIDQWLQPFHSGCGGSGLGLAIVRSTMLAHGGSVDLKNRVDRPGAEATLCWPLRDAHSGTGP